MALVSPISILKTKGIVPCSSDKSTGVCEQETPSANSQVASSMNSVEIIDMGEITSKEVEDKKKEIKKGFK